MANENSITTSIVVDFDPGDGEGVLTAEVDSRQDGYNDGETSFRPGDSPAFLVYKSSNVTVTDMIVSYGSIDGLGSGTSQEVENLSFAMEREVSPGKPITSGFSSKWLGADGGAVTQTETKLTGANKVVAVLHVEYTSAFTAYRLTGVPTTLNGETTFSIVIYIAGVYT